LEQFQLGLARSFASRAVAMQSKPLDLQDGNQAPAVVRNKNESMTPVYAFMAAALCASAYLSIGPSVERSMRASFTDAVSLSQLSAQPTRAIQDISSDTVARLDSLGWQAYTAHMKVHHLQGDAVHAADLRAAVESSRAATQLLASEVERVRVSSGRVDGWVSPWGSLSQALEQASGAFDEIVTGQDKGTLLFDQRMGAAEDSAEFFATMMLARMSGTTHTHTLAQLKDEASAQIQLQIEEAGGHRPQ
jgi:hypothetical protein